MYKGKEICQGCSKTGEENPGDKKESLCSKCKTSFNLGLSIEFEKNTAYTTVRDWYNGFSSIDFDDKMLDCLGNELFQALNNPNAKPTGAQISTDRGQHNGSALYTIPTNVVEPLNKFLRCLNSKIREIREIKNNADLYARNAVSLEKDKIYNEGVEAGRNLLFQLNNGEITTTDFDKKLKYNGASTG